MSGDVSWYLEKRVIFGRVAGSLSLEATYKGGARVWQLVREGTAPVHFLLDATDLERFDSDLRQLRDAASFLAERAFGWMIIYGLSHDPVARSVVNALSQLYRHHIRMVPTREAALAFLVEQDDTLSDLLP